MCVDQEKAEAAEILGRPKSSQEQTMKFRDLGVPTASKVVKFAHDHRVSVWESALSIERGKKRREQWGRGG